eukprot:scaffold233419_cov33-Attheya_sp.AAC.2
MERRVPAINGLHRENNCDSTTGVHGNRHVRETSKPELMLLLELLEPPGGSGKTDRVLFTGGGPTNTLRQSEMDCQFTLYESLQNTLRLSRT